MFIDFKAAYDSVKKNELWLISQYDFPAKLIRLIHIRNAGWVDQINIILNVGVIVTFVREVKIRMEAANKDFYGWCRGR